MQGFEPGLASEFPMLSCVALLSSSALRCSIAGVRRYGYVLCIQPGSKPLQALCEQTGTCWEMQSGDVDVETTADHSNANES